MSVLFERARRMQSSRVRTSLPPATWSCSSCGGGSSAAAFCRGPLLRAASSCGLSCAFEEALHTRLTLITAKKTQSILIHHPPKFYFRPTGLLLPKYFYALFASCSKGTF